MTKALECRVNQDAIVIDRGESGLLVADFSGIGVKTTTCSGSQRERVLEALQKGEEGEAWDSETAKLMRRVGLCERLGLRDGALNGRAMSRGLSVRIEVGLSRGQLATAFNWLTSWLRNSDQSISWRRVIRLVGGEDPASFREMFELIARTSAATDDVGALEWEVELDHTVDLGGLETELDRCLRTRPVLVDWSELDGDESRGLLVARELSLGGFEPIVELPTRLGQGAASEIYERIRSVPNAHAFVVVPMLLDRFRTRRVAAITTARDFGIAWGSMLSLAEALGDQVGVVDPWRALLVQATEGRRSRELRPTATRFAHFENGRRYPSRAHMEWGMRESNYAALGDRLCGAQQCIDCDFRVPCPGPWSPAAEILSNSGEHSRSKRVAELSCKMAMEMIPELLEVLVNRSSEERLFEDGRMSLDIGERGGMTFIREPELS